MKIEQRKWELSKGWQTIGKEIGDSKADLVLVFGDRFDLNQAQLVEISQKYPHARIVSASTAGNILDTTVEDRSIVSTAIAFEKDSHIDIHSINVQEEPDSKKAGKKVAAKLLKEGLRHVFVLADGHVVNGSQLVEGILNEFPNTVTITGGLAGDSIRFEKTIVGVDQNLNEGEIVLIGFYGESLKFGFGSGGGWDPFGIERLITKSNDNVLYTLDDTPALELYKNYLGEFAKDLPASALLFPLAIRPNHETEAIVRTILKIDEKSNSLIFAGDIPKGWYAQLMKANFERLIDGSSKAVSTIHQSLDAEADLIILVSCVGRKMVLHNRIEEELEVVRDILGKNAVITGFYSYGEIAPIAKGVNSQLHNQTMTITTIKEV
jgi:hypothetical protein